MPCRIAVLPRLTRIEGQGLWLEGVALDCEAVQVWLDDAAAADIVFDRGLWRARFVDRPLACGASFEFTIVVQCDAACDDGPWVGKPTLPVRCATLTCPPKSADGLTVTPCVGGGSETELAIRFDGPLDDPAWGWFTASDGARVVTTPPVEVLNGRCSARLLLEPGDWAFGFERLGGPGLCEWTRQVLPGCRCAAELVLELLDRDDAVAARVDAASSGSVPGCVDASRGPFSVRATATPTGPDRRFDWFVDGASTPLPGVQGALLEGVVIAEGGSFSARVVLHQPGCNGLQTELRITGCPAAPSCPPAYRVELRQGGVGGLVLFAVVSDAPDAMALPPTFAAGDPATPCLNPGDYSLVVTRPATAAGVQFAWTGPDGRRIAGADGATLARSLDTAQAGVVTLVVQVPGGLCATVPVPLQLCACPAALELRLVDADDGGRDVTDQACLPPGRYEARALGASEAESAFEWRIDGRTSGATGATLPFELKTRLACGVGAGRVPIEVSARPRRNRLACAPGAARELQICPEYVVCIECWLLRLLAVTLVGVIALGMLFALCPGLCDVGVLRWLGNAAQAGGGTVLMSVLWGIWGAVLSVCFYLSRVLVGLAGLALIALLVVLWWYRRRCRPQWCLDWLPLIWQALLVVGLLLLFYASCPTCIPLLDGTGLVMLLPGALCTAGGLGLWAWWAFGPCRVPRCRALAELAAVGLIPKVFVNGIILLILAPCVWTHGGWVILTFDFAFFLIGVAAVVCFARERRWNLFS